MSLASGRVKRVNAGARMSKLINEEEEDEFYSTAYGGFAEVEDDKEFVERAEDQEEDYVDSDFDIDETEEIPNEGENKDDADEEFKRRRITRGVFTKAYKEPLPKSEIKKERSKVDKAESNNEKIKREPSDEISNTTEAKENKTFRQTTALKRKELEKRQQEREANRLKTKKVSDETDVREYRRLTQEELLNEAKITEEINLASLDAYQKLELEKKKIKSNKNAIHGPVIRYHSATMPFIDIDEEMYGDSKEPVDQKQSRNFITFPDEESLKLYFNSEKPEVVHKQQKCAVTGLPAKYFDPLTNCPYANLFAFKKLREIYEIAAKKSADKACENLKAKEMKTVE